LFLGSTWAPAPFELGSFWLTHAHRHLRLITRLASSRMLASTRGRRWQETHVRWNRHGLGAWKRTKRALLRPHYDGHGSL